MSVRLVPYNATATLYFFLRDRATLDVKTGVTFSAGEWTISKDGGAWASLATLPTMDGSGQVTVTLSAAETSCARLSLRCVSSATPKSWEDLADVVNTYGNASSGHPTLGTLTGYSLTSAYDPAKTAAQAGDAMALTSGERTTLATAVWASGTRTLSSFGTLVADVWASATRTLSAFGFTVDTNANATETAIKAKTDLIPADPAETSDLAALATQSTLLAVKAKTDNLPASPAAVGSSMSLNLSQTVPSTNVAGTVGDSLNAARAQGFGKWTKSGTTLTLYAPDGTTVVRTFTLDDADAPTSRT